MDAQCTPPPERYNFAQDLLVRNAARGAKMAYVASAYTEPGPNVAANPPPTGDRQWQPEQPAQRYAL